MKIISLVPSLTELLFDLGLEEQIVGRTKFCIHPKDRVNSIAKIGGTKNVNISKVDALAPDLILANKEENTKEQILELSKRHNVLLTEIATYSDALTEIKNIGIATNTEDSADKLIVRIKDAFGSIPKMKLPVKVCYLIWQKPYMTIGNDTYIHNMLEVCGFVNVFDNQERYPVVTIDEIEEENPAFVFLSSEPFPFDQKHIDELQELLPKTKVILVDGEYFSWYGNRMIGAASYFSDLISELDKPF